MNDARRPASLPVGGPAPGSHPSDRGSSVLLLVVLLGILWGTAFPVIRAGLVAGAPPLYFAAARYVLTALALVFLAVVARSDRPRLGDLVPTALFGGLFMIGLYGGLLYLGEESTSGGLAAVLTASAPLASAVFGYRLLPGERFGRWGLSGLLVGFVGVGILVLPQLALPSATGFVGPALVVAAVLAFALGSVLLRHTSRVTPGLWTLALQFAVAGGFVGALGLLTREPMGLGSGGAVLPALGFLVVFPGILGYSLYFHLHHTAGPARANIVGYVNPVTGLLVGLLIFGEVVTGVEVGGLVLIATGLFLLQRDRLRGPASRTPTPSDPSATTDASGGSSDPRPTGRT